MMGPGLMARRRASRTMRALVAAVGLLAAACASPGSSGAREASAIYPLTVTDHYGAETKIDSAGGVVAAYGAFSDAIFGMGEGDRLVGVEQFADWPPGEIERIPDIGKYSDLSVEGIVGLGADLLIISDRYLALATRLTVEQLEAAGVSVLLLPEERRSKEEGGYSLAIIEDSVRMIAQALAVPEKGEQLIAQMRADEAAARRAAAEQCKQRRVLNFRSVASGKTFVTGKLSVGELFVELTGSVDVGSEAGFEGFAEPEPEAVQRLNPEVIFGLDEHWDNGKDGVAYHRDLPGLAGTEAAETGRIFPVQNLSVATSWRLPGHARELAERLARLEC